ncbi:MAG: heme-binding protein, partial [Dolichospermum sp.]
MRITHSITIQSVALASALRLTTEAIKHAQSRNWKIAVVVVDSAGAAVASARMDGVNAITGDIALDKAYTAA